MSHDEKIRRSSKESSDDGPPEIELRLQIDLRLNLDEVADASIEVIRAQPQQLPSESELCQLACKMFDARRRRDRMLSQSLFGEPAWDMLLALYCLPARGEMLSVTALTHAANIPQSTGVRWQAILTAEGLIERGPVSLDLRRQNVRLTVKGKTLMTEYLTKLFHCRTSVPPSPEAV